MPCQTRPNRLLHCLHSLRDSQSFQHRTLVPVRPPCLDSGTTLRYDSLTWSDGPPSCEPFVRCSALLPTNPHTPTGPSVTFTAARPQSCCASSRVPGCSLHALSPLTSSGCEITPGTPILLDEPTRQQPAFDHSDFRHGHLTASHRRHCPPRRSR